MYALIRIRRTVRGLLRANAATVATQSDGQAPGTRAETPQAIVAGSPWSDRRSELVQNPVQPGTSTRNLRGPNPPQQQRPCSGSSPLRDRYGTVSSGSEGSLARRRQALPKTCCPDQSPSPPSPRSGWLKPPDGPQPRQS